MLSNGEAGKRLESLGKGPRVGVETWLVFSKH